MPRFFDVFGDAAAAGPDVRAGRGALRRQCRGRSSVKAFWARRFDRSPAAIGARLIVGGTGYTIVGVMPRAFTSAAIDVWVPAQLSPRVLRGREARFLTGVGRIKRGVTLPRRRADLARVQAQLGAQYPRTDKDWSRRRARPEGGRASATTVAPMFLVFGAVALLFAIAIANVAGLVLVQLHRRASEFAIRAAIGASRRQVVGAVMREAAIVAALGAVAGARSLVADAPRRPRRSRPIPRMAEVGARSARARVRRADPASRPRRCSACCPRSPRRAGALPALLSSAGRGGSTGRAPAAGRHRRRATRARRRARRQRRAARPQLRRAERR